MAQSLGQQAIDPAAAFLSWANLAMQMRSAQPLDELAVRDLRVPSTVRPATENSAQGMLPEGHPIREITDDDPPSADASAPHADAPDVADAKMKELLASKAEGTKTEGKEGNRAKGSKGQAARPCKWRD